MHRSGDFQPPLTAVGCSSWNCVSLIVVAGFMSNPVRFDQSQTAVKVRLGDAFVIELPSAPTTGAAWQLAGGGLKLESESFVAKSDRMGAGGMQEFTFQATQAGSHTLSFQHGRPWETSVTSTHDVVVTVED